MEGVGEIVPQSGVGRLWIMLGLQLSFINANELLSFAGFFAKTVVRDPVEPGRKARFTAKAAEVFVGAQEGFLGQIVRERDIGADELAEQTSHARLMIPHELRKGVVVIIEKNAGDEVCIGERHFRSLGQRRNFVSTALQLPDKQITQANQERDHSQAPRAAIPVIHCAEKDH